VESGMSVRLVFNLMLLGVAAYFVWTASGYEPAARRIPIMIGVLVLALQAWVTLKEYLKPEALPPEERFSPGERRGVAFMAAWMALFFLLFALLGTVVAVLIFIFLFLVSGRRLHWWGAAALAGGLSGGIWLLFVRMMRFELYPGLVFGGTLPPL
jgi:hypothetical protein